MMMMMKFIVIICLAPKSLLQHIFIRGLLHCLFHHLLGSYIHVLCFDSEFSGNIHQSCCIGGQMK